MTKKDEKNSSRSEWLFNEFMAIGVDYQRSSVVREYESRHKKFRDFAAEARRLRDRTGMTMSDSVVDLGCGTGALVCQYAPFCQKVDAVDVSALMLSELEKNAREKEIKNIATHHAGFLTYRHPKESADLIVSTIALHHLPDFWKVCALERIRQSLRLGGIFYITDVFFTFDFHKWEEGLDYILETMGGSAVRANAAAHLREEFSTYDWLFEKMLQETGFQIEKQYEETPFLRTYLTRKI